MYPVGHGKQATPWDVLDFNPNVTAYLKALTEDLPALPHVLLYGPSGSGKRTRINVFLHAIHNKASTSPFEVSLMTLTLKNQASYKYRCDNVVYTTIASSLYHVEILLDQLERHHLCNVLQAVLQYLSAGKHLNVSSSSSSLTQQKPALTFRCIVLHNIDQLPIEAQLALRRSMETLIMYCRFIMTATNTNNVNEALMSRCVCIRNAAPTPVDIQRVLYKQKTPVPPAILKQRDLNKVLAAVEMKEAGATDDDVVSVPWQQYTRAILQQSITWRLSEPTQDGHSHVIHFQSMRKAFYELLSRGIDAAAIFNVFLDVVSRHDQLTDMQKKRVFHSIATYEHKAKLGDDPIFYLEAWLRLFHLLIVDGVD